MAPLPALQPFAVLIERHWDGITADCHPRHKVKWGFIEGLENKIRWIQRRADDNRAEESMRLKIFTAFLPNLHDS